MGSHSNKEEAGQGGILLSWHGPSLPESLGPYQGLGG